MKHARQDYNRIQDPDGKIGEDEPVMPQTRPMEKAPKDGRYIVIFGELTNNRKQRPLLARWKPWFEGGEPYWETSLPGICDEVCKPQWWCPIAEEGQS